MAEFRSISALSQVHLAPVLAERVCAVLGAEGPTLKVRGEAWAYVSGTIAHGVAGIEPVWPGRFVLWSYTGDLTAGDWKRILRFTRLRLARKLQDPEVRRIEATALSRAASDCRFLEALGLVREGRLVNYGPKGETMDMFAVVPA